LIWFHCLRLYLGSCISFFILICLAALMLAGSGARAADGDLAWQDAFDLGGGDNEARAVDLYGNQVFVAGAGSEGNWLVRAYASRGGRLLWQDVFDLGDLASYALDIVAETNYVYTAGLSMKPSEDNIVWVVRANDVGNGSLLWQDVFDPDGNDTLAQAVDVSEDKVYVAGVGTNPLSMTDDWVVRTHDKMSGDLIWQDRFDPSEGDAGANAIVVYGSRVFVAGGSTDHMTEGDWRIRAYDAGSGDLLWQDVFKVVGDGLENQAYAIAALDKTVFAAGGVTIEGTYYWVVRAYDQETGGLVWQDQFDVELGPGARGITASGSMVFATGGSFNGASGTWIDRAYDAETGQIVWEGRLELSPLGDNDQGGRAITFKEGRVYAAGNGFFDTEKWIVRAYDAGNGVVLWQDLFDLGEGDNIAFDIDAENNRVVAVGFGETSSFVDEWLVRAYEARSIPVRTIPALSQWGLIALAGVLGILGLLAVRRRETAQNRD